MKITFDEIPPNLNEIVAMNKTHWSAYSKKKSYWKELVRLKTLRIKKIDKPVEIEMTLTFPTNRRRDPDNYFACYKMIMDGLVCLQDDNQTIVKKLTLNEFIYSKGVTRCEIEIKESK